MKATMNVMRKLMYNCLAKKINFKGIDPNSGKIALEKCHLWNLIQGTLHTLYFFYILYKVVSEFWKRKIVKVNQVKLSKRVMYHFPKIVIAIKL